MQPKKRIIHLIQTLNSGGCENMLLRTLPLLREFDHTIITLKELGELAPKFTANGIPVRTVHCNNLLDIPGIIRLQRLVREEAPDIIITYLFHADMLGRLFLRKETVAPIIPFLRTTYNHPRYFIARILAWITKSFVRQYLANSEAVKDFYVEHIGVSAKKITVIPNGIDTEYFDQLTPDPGLRVSLDIAPDDFLIICVANLHPNKGHRYLLEAFEQLHTLHSFQAGESQKGLKLLLVGEGTERKNLERQIKQYQSKSNILFLGRRTDVPQLLKISNLFVLPTLFEGMSNAILEAMATGLPVITTNIPENREIIRHNETGLLITPKSTLSLVEAIENILYDKQKSEAISKTAHKQSRDCFSLNIIASKLDYFFTTL